VVEIRVSVEDAVGASDLMQRLARLFDSSSMWFDWPHGEVRVESEWESRAIAGVVEIVGSWLEEGGAESATLSVGGRAHTMVTPTPLAVSP